MRRLRWNRWDVGAFALAVLGAGAVTAQLADSVVTRSAKSPHVYAEPLPTLRFSHAKHADQACATCHAAALTSQRAQDSLTPPMTACVDCHNSSDKAPAVSKCGTCHTGMAHESAEPVERAEQWRAVRPAPMIPPQPQAALRFNHAKHVPRMGGAKSCATCHGGGAEPSMPSMQSCNTCHDGQSAPSSCATCHPTGGDGKLRGRQRADVQTLLPSNHDAAFLKRHASVAKSSMQDCMACHVEEDCAECHNAVSAAPFAVHPPNFLTIHAVDARMNPGNCSDCHTVQTFCTSCHVRADVTTQAPHDPPPRRQYHPPGWLESSAANNHGVMARREITECASCHVEQDCITCHAGVNPHPPEFVTSCRQMLEANISACVKCHSDPSALRMMCL